MLRSYFTTKLSVSSSKAGDVVDFFKVRDVIRGPTKSGRGGNTERIKTN
jgi:hypothetical protein